MISAAIIGTQAGVMIQTLGVFSDLSLVWEEPVRSLLQLMQLVNFDFDIIKMNCALVVQRHASFAVLEAPGTCEVARTFGLFPSSIQGCHR